MVISRDIRWLATHQEQQTLPAGPDLVHLESVPSTEQSIRSAVYFCPDNIDIHRSACSIWYRDDVIKWEHFPR